MAKHKSYVLDPVDRAVLYFLSIFLAVAFIVGIVQNKFHFFETQRQAEQGAAIAQSDLGWMYYSGNGVVKDYAKGLEWYRRAADQGYPYAQIKLGWLYYNGEGVAQNYAEAAKWYHKAADLGYAEAQINLAQMYYEGKGITQNKAEALKWYRKAADRGDPQAQYTLGEMYANGKAVQPDPVEAYKWLSLAITYRYSTKERLGKAKGLLASLQSKMTPAQIAEAKKQVAAWCQGRCRIITSARQSESK